MTNDQAAVLQTMTEVLRGFTMMICALHPHKTGDVATILETFAKEAKHDLRPESRQILLHLAEFPANLASALAESDPQKH